MAPQLTQEQRYQIYELKGTMSHALIASAIGTHRTTVSRELKRNKSLRGYRPDRAQKLRDERKKAACTAYTIPTSLWVTVIRLLKGKFSPKQIALRLKHEQDIRISHETIYKYVYADKGANGDLHTNLRCQKLRRKRYASGEQKRGVLKNQKNISLRPSIVDLKQRIGDFEGDTVIGKKHQGGLVTLVDRSSRFLLAAPIPCKRSDVVTGNILTLLTPFKDKCFTITFDNGKEFAEHERIADGLGIDIYFANPYHSWERGANENTNGLLRQYFPKGTVLTGLTNQKVQEAVDQINHRPRKVLNWKSAYEVFYGVELRYTD